MIDNVIDSDNKFNARFLHFLMIWFLMVVENKH